VGVAVVVPAPWAAPVRVLQAAMAARAHRQVSTTQQRLGPVAAAAGLTAEALPEQVVLVEVARVVSQRLVRQAAQILVLGVAVQVQVVTAALVAAASLL